MPYRVKNYFLTQQRTLFSHAETSENIRADKMGQPNTAAR